MLYVPEDDRLYCQFRKEWNDFSAEAIEALRELADDFAAKATEMGGGEVLRYMEDSLSNTLRITERSAILIASCPVDPAEEFPELDELFRVHVKA
jgi:hypothetical protein